MTQTLVVKIGTSSLTQSASGQLALSTIATLVETLTQLQQLGYRVVLVSSGAVGVGCGCLNLKERPKKIAFKQAIAAVGQGRLIRVYDDLFTTIGQPIAQVLLTRRELIERSCYVNVSNTFRALFELGVIPIVNENDTVATEELKFGDNDTLSALVASVIHADWLFLLTDVDRLYSADPRLVQDAQPITLVNAEKIDQLKVNAGNKGSQWGTGGMETKLTAVRLATSAGVRTVITHGQKPGNLLKILRGKAIGTQFEPQPRSENARKRWIAYGLVPSGQLYLDQGAIEAICHQGKSLLAAGIIKVEGQFEAFDAIQLCDKQGQELARGIVNYSSLEVTKIKGHHSDKIAKILGYEGPQTMVHRDNLVVQESYKFWKPNIIPQS
ncbi:glutamate 5-kinase [cyanobacterium endosymbiont of Epithemia turgida]|uniref:glutamate 5-kinase n=1 Tax=cyanobacterium endosymbiont of Epithemia turgida TaxID=718217 RepID=UPI0004D1F72E|nr:glutamate 5-kinase [cyanobacterium endosymbiont of Epithemia turgida]BAP17858.1 gamma-glutamyl kinase [cyanobacterium endosymbiont of Epithemia turgida isolate EtSB Lake Yunoko]